MNRAQRHRLPQKLACRTSERRLPSRNHPVSAPSPGSAAPKTSSNGSRRWQTSRSGRAGRGWRPWPRPRRSCVTCPMSLCVTRKFRGRLSLRAKFQKTRNQAGQVLPRATLWVGGLHAFLQHAIHLSFYKREVSEANFKLFALAFQTIYDAAAQRAHNSTRCVIHYATGNSEEEGATLKLTHGETAFQKFRAVTGLEPSRVLAPAGRGPADRGYPRQNQRETEDDNRWYWHEDRRAAPKRPWQPWQSDRWNP